MLWGTVYLYSNPIVWTFTYTHIYKYLRFFYIKKIWFINIETGKILSTWTIRWNLTIASVIIFHFIHQWDVKESVFLRHVFIFAYGLRLQYARGNSFSVPAVENFTSCFTSYAQTFCEKPDEKTFHLSIFQCTTFTIFSFPLNLNC